MILTITANPSIDTSYRMNEFILDTVNRCSDIYKTAGGKGLNVTKVLKILGSDVLAMGFVGGKSGEFISKYLDDRGVKTDFVETNSDTRTCIAISHGDLHTEILESGGKLSSLYEKKFFEKLELLNSEFKVAAISGSVPQGLSSDFYIKIIKKLKSKGIKVLLDTSEELLKRIFDDENYVKPYGIKPNLNEFKQIFDIDSDVDLTIDEIYKMLKSEKFKDIELVVVSMGSKGAVCKSGKNYYILKIPRIKLVSPVGSGDSVVAGLAYSIEKELSDEKMLKNSMTCGVLNSMQEITGFINIDDFKKVYNKIDIVKLNV